MIKGLFLLIYKYITASMLAFGTIFGVKMSNLTGPEKKNIESERELAYLFSSAIIQAWPK